MHKSGKTRRIGTGIALLVVVLVTALLSGCFLFQEKAQSAELQLEDRWGNSIPRAQVQLWDQEGSLLFTGKSNDKGVVNFSAKKGYVRVVATDELLFADGTIVLDGKENRYMLQLTEEKNPGAGGLVWRNKDDTLTLYLFVPANAKVVLFSASSTGAVPETLNEIPMLETGEEQAYLWFTRQPAKESQLVELAGLWAAGREEPDISRIEIYSGEGEQLYGKGEAITPQEISQRQFIPNSELSKVGDISSLGGESNTPDGIVDVWDLIYLLNRYEATDTIADLGKLGATVVTPPLGPFSHNLDQTGKDGIVDVWDLIILLNAYGATVESINTPFAPTGVEAQSTGGNAYQISWEVAFENDCQEAFYFFALDSTEGFEPTTNHVSLVGQVGKNERSFTVTTDKAYIAICARNNPEGVVFGMYFSTPVFIPMKPGMVFVEGGSFQMGNTRNDPEGYSDEKPVHTVSFTYAFEIGTHEVTFEQYDAYCADTGAVYPDDEGWGRGTRPVINVGWYNGITYCNWLSEQEGLAVAYDSEGNLLDKYGRLTEDITEVEGYRLPTEAEWEYAARGGHKSLRDYKYAGSDDLESVVWYWFNSDTGSGRKTHPVRLKAANELGLYDMGGNVWEWCHDWYGSYGSSSQTNPIGPEAGPRRVIRGGGWNTDERNCRVARRRNYSFRSYNLGFRLARTY